MEDITLQDLLNALEAAGPESARTAKMLRAGGDQYVQAVLDNPAATGHAELQRALGLLQRERAGTQGYSPASEGWLTPNEQRAMEAMQLGELGGSQPFTGGVAGTRSGERIGERAAAAQTLATPPDAQFLDALLREVLVPPTLAGVVLDTDPVVRARVVTTDTPQAREVMQRLEEARGDYELVQRSLKQAAEVINDPELSPELREQLERVIPDGRASRDILAARVREYTGQLREILRGVDPRAALYEPSSSVWNLPRSEALPPQVQQGSLAAEWQSAIKAAQENPTPDTLAAAREALRRAQNPLLHDIPEGAALTPGAYLALTVGKSGVPRLSNPETVGQMLAALGVQARIETSRRTRPSGKLRLQPGEAAVEHLLEQLRSGGAELSNWRPPPRGTAVWHVLDETGNITALRNDDMRLRGASTIAWHMEAADRLAPALAAAHREVISFAPGTPAHRTATEHYSRILSVYNSNLDALSLRASALVSSGTFRNYDELARAALDLRATRPSQRTGTLSNMLAELQDLDPSVPDKLAERSLFVESAQKSLEDLRAGAKRYGLSVRPQYQARRGGYTITDETGKAISVPVYPEDILDTAHDLEQQLSKEMKKRESPPRRVALDSGSLMSWYMDAMTGGWIRSVGENARSLAEAVSSIANMPVEPKGRVRVMPTSGKLADLNPKAAARALSELKAAMQASDKLRSVQVPGLDVEGLPPGTPLSEGRFAVGAGPQKFPFTGEESPVGLRHTPKATRNMAKAYRRLLLLSEITDARQATANMVAPVMQHALAAIAKQHGNAALSHGGWPGALAKFAGMSPNAQTTPLPSWLIEAVEAARASEPGQARAAIAATMRRAGITQPRQVGIVRADQLATLTQQRNPYRYIIVEDADGRALGAYRAAYQYHAPQITRRRRRGSLTVEEANRSLAGARMHLP